MSPLKDSDPALTKAGAERRRLLKAAMLAPAAIAAAPVARAMEPAVIDAKVDDALQHMMRLKGVPDLMEQARGVLIIPEVLKGGLILGGAYGEGALRMNGMTVGYYSQSGASLGLQFGIQTYGIALFFMTTSTLEDFRRSEGWEIGADAEVAVIDTGAMGTVTSTNTNNQVIALVFGQEGLMAGVSIEGTKYTRLGA